MFQPRCVGEAVERPTYRYRIENKPRTAAATSKTGAEEEDWNAANLRTFCQFCDFHYMNCLFFYRKAATVCDPIAMFRRQKKADKNCLPMAKTWAAWKCERKRGIVLKVFHSALCEYFHFLFRLSGFLDSGRTLSDESQIRTLHRCPLSLREIIVYFEFSRFSLLFKNFLKIHLKFLFTTSRMNMS